MHRVYLLLFVVATAGYGQIIRTIEPGNPGRGDAVTMTFAGDADAVPDQVRLYYPLARREATRELAAEVPLLHVSDEKPQFRFFVPDYLPFGAYDVAIAVVSGETEGENQTTNATRDVFLGRIRVTLQTAPKITSVSPRVLYPGEARKLTIVGDFTLDPSDYALALNDRIYPPCTGKLVPGKECVVVKSALAGRALTFENIPADDPNDPQSFGEQRVQVKVDRQDAVFEQSLLVPWAKRTTPRTLAMWATLIVAVIVLLPLLLSKVPNQTWLGKLAETGRILFVDSQTNTYSLSKIQLYLWMLAAVFGWVYLTACLSLVQGHFDFAPLPKNMPGILLFSLGTATLAGGINHVRPKGAGTRQPALSDLVTSGGVVVPERVQYLVWTVLGFSAFLVLVLSTDPSTVKELPHVPEEFLYVMGLSSAGYLGGKLVRQPGPILTAGSISPGSLVITICGRNLSPMASVTLNDVNLQPAWMDGMRGETLVPEDNAQYAQQLRFRFERGRIAIASEGPTQVLLPNEKVLESPFRFRLVNPDGQAAEWRLEVDSLETPALPVRKVQLRTPTRPSP